MKKFKYIAMGLICGSLMLGSCGEFGDLNMDPNRPSDPLTSSLLTGSQRFITNVVGDATSVLYSQHLAEKQYTEASRYQTIYFDFNAFYSGPLMNLQRIIELNTDEETRLDVSSAGSNNNQIAVARILKAYYFSVLTDRWGEIPYSNALQGAANFAPQYDTQEFIYNDLLKELEEAAAQIDEGQSVQGDFLFNGNMDNWRRFANSLRMVLSLRLSNVAPQVAQSNFVSAYQGGILTADFMYPYLAEANNQNPWFARYLTRVDYAISNTLHDYMAPLNDPRLPVYADPAAESGSINPMPYGVTNTVAGSITNAEVSYLGSFYRGQSSPLPILTVSQLNFSLAEAAHRGWIAESAADLYEDAIRASMEANGVYDPARFDAFMAQADVAWSDARALELIGNQKWVALFLQGFEAWSEWRRLGYPELSPAPDALNQSREIPRRQAYPTTERDINTSSWNEAVSRQGPDELDTRIWWDVN
ncbi:SusD/RagB family nutrient-binding outer membrane lipoprotein [Litoribacter alkaliphilus]|uniref:SusD/RagB family nutrient-binding outer membrane lipoprotein n=1 Tax=Litoribacter ruber TaxID=702568 RepID=A0AAP2G246_9BACT|nr:SusD/RagB family nutrient-binding outer membrane lipoprotein [Litoribacter alkaliphilus]MBS9525619.1 SusD/RagB family nutrient-binding outer membrane lipoprotein [Litoribacter alkaliphilus]